MNKKEIIKIMIDKEEDYLDKFNDDKLSQDLSNYILEECRGVPLKKSIALDIKFDYQASDLEKEKIVRLIRKNYGIEVKENLIYLKHSLWRKLSIFTIGIIFLLIYYFTDETNNFLFSEIALILGWGAIWETVYAYALDDNKRRIRTKRLKKITKCEIIFE